METDEKTCEAPAVEAAVANETSAQTETAKKPAVEVTDEMIEKSLEILRKMLSLLQLPAEVRGEKKASKINLTVKSEEAGRIIGRKGQTLENLQFILNRIMQKQYELCPKVYVDIDGYASGKFVTHDGNPQERKPNGSNGKDAILKQQALDAAKEVKKWGEPVILPEMNAHDRRIIHITLENDENVATESKGEGSMKKVEIFLKK